VVIKVANEVKYSGLADQRLSETLNQEVLLALADRNALQQHPALVYAGDCGQSGSTVIKTSQIGWMGYDQLASVAESAAPGNSALVDASSTITVARYAKEYQVTDLASITDSSLFQNPGFWAQDAVASSAMTLTNLIAALAGGFSTVKGSTTVNMTLANWFDALSALEIANVSGPYMAVLHPQQYHDLQAALRAESSSAIAFSPATVEQIAVRGPGFKGSFFGADIFTSAQCGTANSGADRSGGVWGRGAIGWADATPVVDVSANAIVAGKILIAMDYDPSTAQKKVVTNSYLGAAEMIDLCGVSIITDA